MLNVNAETYQILSDAYDFFNDRLFDGELPKIAITLQRKKNAYGYFHAEQFQSTDKETVHEIAMNPDGFLPDRRHRTPADTMKDIVSTLVHEQAHCWQQVYGKPSRNGYHNKQWARKMHEIGLIPSTTGAPGGKETGPRVSHYIPNFGKFSTAYPDFVKQCEGKGIKWGAVPTLTAARPVSKVKYTCPECGQNAWAKPGAELQCGYHRLAMISEESDED